MRSAALFPFLISALCAQEPLQEIPTPRSPSIGSAVKLAPPTDERIAPETESTNAEPLPASGPRRPVADKWVYDAGRRGIEAAFEDPDFVAIDDPDDDAPIWAVGNTFKVGFDANGWQFIGKPAEGAPELQPIGFRLDTATVDGLALEVRASAPTRTDRRVEYRHGDVVQAIDISGRGVEQTFTFEHLPQRGELSLSVEVDTALNVTQEVDGIRFKGDYDDVSYSSAIAIDARGERVAAPTTWEDGRIRIRVPADFVERAQLPLRIDPWVAAILVYSSSSGDLAEPDIAWDETGQVWAITFTRYFAANDWDCYVQRVSRGNPMVLVGGVTVIDASTAGWQFSRIANLAVYDVFMVVAQVRSGTLPKKVWGRMMANSGPVVTNQFLIASSSVDELRPDIGGNPAVPPPVYFTVVWEHAYSATDHDIYARQIEPNGALRGSGPIYIQANTANQTWPSISKSCGAAPAATQRFGIVYQQPTGFGDHDIYGALLTWDGVIVPVGGSSTFPINNTLTENDTMPQVSSPTLDFNGRRRLLAVYERTNSNNGDIRATCFDESGTLLASGNINVLEYDPIGRLTWPQRRPCVDSDGLRFVVGYHEVYNNNTTVNDLDTKVSLVALTGSTLTLEERGVPLAISQDREFSVQIASRYSGSGAYSPNTCTTHDRDTLLNTFATDAYAYDAIPYGGFATRGTGCGTLPITYSGLPQLGGSINFSISFNSGPAGFLIGAPVSIALPPCGGCTLGADGALLYGNTWAHTVISNPGFIGVTFSVQGFVFDPSGSACLGGIRLTDTVDITVL